VHGDFHNENIIFDLQEVAWILDFEYTTVGDPFDDIGQFIDKATCNYGFGDREILLAGAFINGYRNIRNISADEFAVGMKYYLVTFCNSTYFERRVAEKCGLEMEGYIKRDTRKANEILMNFEHIVHKIFNASLD
jgi:thiamine kinase-like enzyme